VQRQTDAERRRKNPLHDPRVQAAIADPYIWATQFTKTYNPHWMEEGRPSPYEPFPPFEEYPHILDLFEAFADERIHFIEKSRDMMISWACVAYFTLEAMRVPERQIIFQTQKKDKVQELIDYAKCLYVHQPKWLRDAFPLSKPLRLQSKLSLDFAHGGGILGLPAGADQIRSYHPWGYFLDEASFVPDAGECYNAALAVAKGKIILNSSAGPGWFADVRHDIVRNCEET
jgi:hypothetical protein